MNIKYPLLIPIIGHGATDIIDFPIQTLLYNLIGHRTFDFGILLIIYSLLSIKVDNNLLKNVPSLVIVAFFRPKEFKQFENEKLFIITNHGTSNLLTETS